MQTIMAYDQVCGAMVTALLYLARSTIVAVEGQHGESSKHLLIVCSGGGRPIYG